MYTNNFTQTGSTPHLNNPSQPSVNYIIHHIPDTAVPNPYQNNVNTFQADMVQGRPHVPMGLFLNRNHDLNGINKRMNRNLMKVDYPKKTNKLKSKADYSIY